MNEQTPSRIDSKQQNPLLRAGLFLYRQLLSPVLHAIQQTLTGATGSCRFQPTCSEYAALAIHTHGARHGGWLALLRFLRCHPFSRGGFDPVPSRPSLAPADDNTPPHGHTLVALPSRETARHLP